MPGSTEILVIALLVVILFGASAIPKFAKSLGEAKKEFKKAVTDKEETEHDNRKKEE